MVDAEKVREMTGLYGPFHLEERQVQKIWASRAFCGRGMVTRSGRRLEILHPGRWNFQEGPDFRDAILELDERRVHGDVEIHFHEKDWKLHGHDSNPDFDNVVLHVVLFPDRKRMPEEGRETAFETLEWLPYLDRDLESYLDDLGLDLLAGEELPEAVRNLADDPVETREDRLFRAARERWERKVEIAGRRIASDGWGAACHQILLETLGLKRNRAPMSRLACEFPVDAWAGDPSGLALRAWESFEDEWKLAGCRPANHPQKRLRAYGEWVSARGVDWAERIPSKWIESGHTGSSDRVPRVSARRKSLRISEAEKRLRAFFAPGVGGTRFHTWMVDGLLPLLTAKDGEDRFAAWFVWPAGDVPDQLRKILGTLEITGPGRPFSSGWAQGLLRVLEPDFTSFTPCGS